MGNGIVQALKKEFEIEDEWVSFEIHPETPAEGMNLADRFPAAGVASMYERLGQMGAPYGVRFGQLSILANSKLALEASEFARDYGDFHAFHNVVFKAYFTDGKNIGDLQTILSLAQSVGLNQVALRQALDEHRYANRLSEAQAAGAGYGVTGTPTFIINGKYSLVGAQPIEVFRNALQKLLNEGP